MIGGRATDATASLLDEARAALTRALAQSLTDADPETPPTGGAPRIAIAEGDRPGFRGEHLVSLTRGWPGSRAQPDRWPGALDRLREVPVICRAELEGGVLRLTLAEAAMGGMLERLASCPDRQPAHAEIDRWSPPALADAAAFSVLLAHRAHLPAGETALARVMRARLGARRERRFAGALEASEGVTPGTSSPELDALLRALLGLDDLRPRPEVTPALPREIARALHHTAGAWHAVASTALARDTPALVHAATAGALEHGLRALGVPPWTLV